MKQLHEITDKFKMTKVRVPMEAPFSEDFQKAMFTMGFRWNDAQPGTPREVRLKHGGIHAYHGLYIDQDCRISGSVIPATFGGSVITSLGYREITPLELFDAAREYKALDKAIRKDKKLAKQGWIEWNGTEPRVTFMSGPVDMGTLVDVKFRSGVVAYNKKAGSIDGPDDYAAGAFWNNDGAHNDIVAYRLSKPETKTVSLQAMIDTIVADAGGKEVLHDGWIVNTGSKPDVQGRIEVRFRNGDVRPASSVDSLNSWRIPYSYPDMTIEAYRPLGAQPAEVAEKAEWELVPMDEPVVEADTNPKKQYGLASIPLNMWSNLASAYGALGLYNGALKYGTANFTHTKVEASIYIAAIKRHLAAWEAGEEFDPADGVPNLGGVLANVAIILEARAAGTLIDDRSAMTGYLKERDALKEIGKTLPTVHAGKTPKHYTLGDIK